MRGRWFAALLVAFTIGALGCGGSEGEHRHARMFESSLPGLVGKTRAEIVAQYGPPQRAFSYSGFGPGRITLIYPGNEDGFLSFASELCVELDAADVCIRAYNHVD